MAVFGRSYGECELCEENNDKEEVMEGTTKLGNLGHKHTADHASKMGRRISWDFKNEWIGLMINYFINEVLDHIT